QREQAQLDLVDHVFQSHRRLRGRACGRNTLRVIRPLLSILAGRRTTARRNWHGDRAEGRGMSRTKGEQFAGVTVALVTPFVGGEVDFAALRRLVDWHVEQGTDGLAPVGTTGESPTLDHDEHERVIAAVCEQAAGRIKVLAGTGSNSTREAIRLTRAARRAGADGALMVGPYSN